MLGLALGAGRAPAWWPDNATFAADFVTGVAMRDGLVKPLSQVMSFSRNSPKFASDIGGRWQSFAANVPAITNRGMLLEPAATNLVVDNTGENSTTLVGVTVTPWTTGDSPAGDNSARRLTQGNGASDAFIRLVSLAGATPYTVSRFYKYDGSATWIRLSISDNIAHGFFAYLNLATMTLGNQGSFGSGTISQCTLTPYANGWCRLAMVGTIPNAASAAGSYSHSVVGNGTTSRSPGSYGIWLDQIEIGTALTSPVQTTGSIGTRSGDNLALILPSVSQALTLSMDSGSVASLNTGGGTVPIPANASAALRLAHCLPG